MGAGGLTLVVMRVPSMHNYYVEAAILASYGVHALQLQLYKHLPCSMRLARLDCSDTSSGRPHSDVLQVVSSDVVERGC